MPHQKTHHYGNKTCLHREDERRLRIEQWKLSLEVQGWNTQAICKAIANYFKTQPVLKAWLFGSFARGEETPISDVDILVEYDSSTRISLMTISRIMVALSDAIGKKVDLVEEGRLLRLPRKALKKTRS